MRILLILVITFNLNVVSADSSVKGFYKVNIKTTSGKSTSGYVGLIDSNSILDPMTIKGPKLEYEFGEKIRLFKEPFIEIEHPAKYFLSKNNIDAVTKSDIESTFYIADTNKIENLPIKNVTEIIITKPVEKLKIKNDIFSQDEILSVEGNNKYLLTNKKPLTFMIYETALNRRLYIFSYGNNGIGNRAELFRYLNRRDNKFNPLNVYRPTVLKEGIYAIPVEYEAETI